MTKRIILFLVVLLLIGTAYWSCNHLFDDPPKPTIVDDTKKQLADMKASEKAYNNKIDSLDLINYNLQSKVAKTQGVLNEVKKENSNLKRTINDLLNIHYTTTDTTEKLENCDSLAATVQDLLLLNITKDSLYENLSADLQRQVSLKDSVIAIKQEQYDTLHTSYNNVLTQKQELVQENTSLRKAVKKQKRGKGFLGAILVAIGTLFALHSLK